MPTTILYIDINSTRVCVKQLPSTSISLTKSGNATLRLELTLPIGCRYTEGNVSHCYEELSFNDPLQNPDACSAGKRVQDAKDTRKSSIVFQVNIYSDLKYFNI